MEDHRRRIPDSVSGRAKFAAIVAAAVAILGAALPAEAQQRGMEYETILLAPKEPADPALVDFIATAKDALWRYAGVCRVQTVLRPYLEAVETHG